MTSGLFFICLSGWWFVADDNGKQGWAPATYLEPLVTSSNDDTGYDWVSVTDENGVGRLFRNKIKALYVNQNVSFFGSQLIT